MTIPLLDLLRERGIHVWSDDGKLRYTAPPGTLTPELRAQMAANREALLAAANGGIPKAAHAAPLPLSAAQERLWFLDRLHPGSATYNVQRALRLRGPLSVERLARAVAEVVRRHEALRSVFTSAGAAILPPAGVPLPVVEALTHSAAEDLLRRERMRPFDLARGPVFRALLLRHGAAEHILCLTVHHIATDGYSMHRILGEIGRLYSGAVLPEPAFQYADFALWQRSRMTGAVLEDHLHWWMGRLGETSPLLDLPADKPRPQTPTTGGASISTRLDPELCRQLERFSREIRSSVFTCMLAAFHVLLHRWTGEDDIRVPTPFAGRTRPEFEDVVGLFVNTPIVRADLSGDPPFREAVRRVHDFVCAAQAYQEVPFEDLLQRMQVMRDPVRGALFQVMFAFLDFGRALPEFDGLQAELLPHEAVEAKNELAIEITRFADSLRAKLVYSLDRFTAEAAGRLLEQYIRLLENALGAPDTPISALDLLSAREREQLLAEWRAPARATGALPCVHFEFERQAQAAPDAPAIQSGETTLTYGELNRRANRLAWKLRREGAGPDGVVAVAMAPSPDAICAILAVLKAGAAYLPIHPELPEPRIAAILQDSGVRLILTEQNAIPPDDAPEDDPPHTNTAAHLAYVIYTSGSTGRPKGVQIEHGALANYTAFACANYRIAPGDRVLQFASLAFDASVEEIFPTLASGAALVLRPPQLETPRAFLQFCARQRITVASLPTGYWHELALGADPAAVPPTLRLVIIGGEQPQRAAVESWRKLAPRVRLLNTYGPTEATVIATWADLTCTPLEPCRVVPAGRPIWNMRACVLDRNLRLVPAGITGELFLGGDGLARGYLHRPDLTAERFLPDPFLAGERLYRTGDLARLLPDGQIEIEGRSDRQVKVRGFRVELEDVEAALGAIPGVRRAAALVRRDPQGANSIAAAVVTDGTCSIAGVRAAAARVLPPYMVPSVIAALDALPLMHSGKIDFRKLAELLPAGQAAPRAGVRPRNETEERLAALWREVLSAGSIGIHDDFFEAGGHSLLAVRLFTRIEQVFGRSLPLDTLFNGLTIARLAEALSGAPDGSDPVLIPIRESGAQPPLFLALPDCRYDLLYRDLARYIDPDVPLFAVRPISSLREEIAGAASVARALEAIVRVQPSGPYALGGYCLGGNLAFAVACELRRSGESVRLLALIDSFSPTYVRPPMVSPPLSRVLRFHYETIRSLPGGKRAGYIAEIGARSLLRRLERLQRRGMPAPPEPPYDGDICILRAAELEPFQQEGDFALGWQDLTSGAVEVVVTPGGHSTILKEPYAGELGRRLNARAAVGDAVLS